MLETGSVLAAGLLDAGARVPVVERGERLAHLRRHGLTIATPNGATRTYPGFALRGPDEPPGEHDMVFLAVKTYDLRAATSTIATALASRTVIVTLQNGIPWWYFQHYAGRLAGYRLKSLDPDGFLAGAVDPDRLIACIPYPAATMTSHGTVRHVEGKRLPVGELDGSISYRLRQLATEMMREAQAVAEALGAHFRVSIERRVAGAEAVGAHRTSMAQDVEAGRPLETEALVGAVIELGEVLGISTPSIRFIYAAVKLLEHRSRSTDTSEALGSPQHHGATRPFRSPLRAA